MRALEAARDRIGRVTSLRGAGRETVRGHLVDLVTLAITPNVVGKSGRSAVVGARAAALHPFAACARAGPQHRGGGAAPGHLAAPICNASLSPRERRAAHTSPNCGCNGPLNSFARPTCGASPISHRATASPTSRTSPVVPCPLSVTRRARSGRSFCQAALFAGADVLCETSATSGPSQGDRARSAHPLRVTGAGTSLGRSPPPRHRRPGASHRAARRDQPGAPRRHPGPASRR